MKTETLGNSKLLNILLKPAGLAMESKIRRWIFRPQKTLQGANLKQGQVVLEVGAGTGFFTIDIAKTIGEKGHLIAIEVLADYVKRISKKVAEDKLNNVTVLKRDALETELETASIDVVLLFGVIPFPSLPLNRLLPEMYRVLKPEGNLAVWLFPSSAWVPKSIRQSGLFEFIDKNNGVYNYKRLPMTN